MSYDSDDFYDNSDLALMEEESSHFPESADEPDFYDDEDVYGTLGGFADPGGTSALRAASRTNPRNLPCPTCQAPNALTPADRARGYQCDRCADAAEGGW